MKKINIVTVIAIILFITPFYSANAQIASTTSDTAAVQVSYLREELINLLMQLITELQTQLNTQSVKNKSQDEEIEIIKKRTTVRNSDVADKAIIEMPVIDELAIARNAIGDIKAMVSLSEENIVFSVVDYLNTDTVTYTANIVASSTDGGCGAIYNSSYMSCGQNAEYPFIETDLIIDVTVNGVEKTLVLKPGKKSMVRVSWPN